MAAGGGVRQREVEEGSGADAEGSEVTHEGRGVVGEQGEVEKGSHGGARRRGGQGEAAVKRLITAISPRLR